MPRGLVGPDTSQQGRTPPTQIAAPGPEELRACSLGWSCPWVTDLTARTGDYWVTWDRCFSVLMGATAWNFGSPQHLLSHPWGVTFITHTPTHTFFRQIPTS